MKAIFEMLGVWFVSNLVIFAVILWQRSSWNLGARRAVIVSLDSDRRDECSRANLPLR
jgi:hypothetical protein